VVFTTAGVVTSILTIAVAGSGYAVGDLLTLAGGNVDATLRIATIGGGGSVTSATILYGGTGYSNGAQLTGTAIPPGDRNVILTGVLTSNVTFIIANGTFDTASRRPSFANNTTGAFTVTVFLSNGADGTTGSGYVLPQGTNNSTSVLLQTDGETNVWPVDSLLGLGAGTMATQNANNVAITGGTESGVAITGDTINSTPIGATTPSTGAFTTLTATTPVGVASGGIGVASLTVHGVLLGEGTSAVSATAAGTSGQMLLGSTGANPLFGNNPTITGGTIDGAVVGGTTPAAGHFTTVSATGAITPSSTNGIVGTTTNDSANAGSIGEYVTNTGTAVSLTTSTATNITSVSLTAGDWDVSGAVTFNPASGTILTIQAGGISTTSAAFGGIGSTTTLDFTAQATQGSTFPTPVERISLASTTTVFLVAEGVFSVSTCTASALIRARRVR
jgi:hypothetical protein